MRSSLVSIIEILLKVINKYDVRIWINNLINGEKFLNISDKKPERKIIKIKVKENNLKSLLKKKKNIIKRNPALKGILKAEVVKFLCLEKLTLSKKKLFLIINLLKAKEAKMNKIK